MVRIGHSKKKYLVGNQKFLKNAMEGERQNDNHVEDLRACGDDHSEQEIQINMDYLKKCEEINNGSMAIPIMIRIGSECSKYPELLAIMDNDKKTTQEERCMFLSILKEMDEDPEEPCNVCDKSNKF